MCTKEKTAPCSNCWKVLASYTGWNTIQTSCLVSPYKASSTLKYSRLSPLLSTYKVYICSQFVSKGNGARLSRQSGFMWAKNRLKNRRNHHKSADQDYFINRFTSKCTQWLSASLTLQNKSKSWHAHTLTSSTPYCLPSGFTFIRKLASSELKSCTTVSPALVVTYASELGLGLRMKLKTSHMPARFYQWITFPVSNY